MDNDIIDTAPPAPAPAPAAAPAEPPSLRETLAKAVETSPIFSEPDREPKELEVQTARAARERGPGGKFAKKNPTGAEVPTEAQVARAQPDLSLDPNDPLDAPEDDPAQTQQPDDTPNVDNAPKSWKAAAKERWATTDPVIKAEVHRREREATRAIAAHAPVKKFTEDFSATIQPFAQHYAQSGIKPLQLMKNLMESDVHLSTAPMPDRARFMARLIKSYGIDINALDMALAGQDPGSSATAGIEQLLEQKLAPVMGFMQTETQRRQAVVQAEQTRAQQVLQRMEADSANFPHFALVAADMADVTEMAAKRGVYLTPQEAYKRAVTLNPEAQAADQSRAGQQRAQVAHDAATRSLGASVSIDGAPSQVRQRVDPSDLRGTIEAAFAAAQGR